MSADAPVTRQGTMCRFGTLGTHHPLGRDEGSSNGKHATLLRKQLVEVQFRHVEQLGGRLANASPAKIDELVESARLD